MNKTFLIESGKVVLSDPCYELGTWCQGIVENVKNGVWVAGVVMKRGRVSQLYAYHDSADIRHRLLNGHDEFLDIVGCVDSGQFGYFDHKHYRDDDSVNDLSRESSELICENEPFYSFCCDRTLSNNRWGVLNYGVVSSSGYGDGSYPTNAIKGENDEYIGFCTTFIFDEDEDFFEE